MPVAITPERAAVATNIFDALWPPMKVIAFNGSPRANGNTQRALQMALDELEKEGIETELVNIGIEPVAPCQACGACRKAKDGKCKITDDRVNEFVGVSNEYFRYPPRNTF